MEFCKDKKTVHHDSPLVVQQQLQPYILARGGSVCVAACMGGDQEVTAHGPWHSSHSL